ncbi:MAG: T9SS type A sorting domain-containing protein [Bacteroidetes bacterium]|jgi:1,4-alpha-glucan branching enzyme|nr:T9SS type A sorting domain-containing protein [Bacteroidota bacterium]
MKKILLNLFLLSFVVLGHAQVQQGNFSINPATFEEDEQITITVSGVDPSIWGVSDVYLWAWYLNPDGSFGGDSPTNGSWTNSDESQKMTDNGDGTFSFTMTPTNFYNTTNIGTLGMLVKADDGTGDKKTQDHLVPVGSFQLFLDSSLDDVNIVDQGNSLTISATTSLAANFELFANGTSIDTQNNTTSYNFNYTVNNDAAFELVATEPNTSEVQTAEFNVITTPVVNNAPVPAGMQDGINYDINNPDEITLVLYAPNKNFVHVIGNFDNNDWNLSNNYLMNRDPSNDRFWITINGLNNHPSNNFLFQYVVDAEINVADPYSELVLDPFNDPFIDNTVFPNIPAYPEDKTTELITWVRLNQPEYQWQVPNFQRPDQDELVVYELLIRDFDAAHTFNSVVNRLDYLEDLGINAIELMPVNEFDGNISWGYNPALHGALDKYYGTPEDFKNFVDECHLRGIAVILDVVYNHATGQNPYYRMWNDCNGCTVGQATNDNPFFNVNDPNTSFSFFNDMDHESTDMEEYMDRMNLYWLEEYNIDGYRFDFTKGFTNVVGDGGGFDASRINNLNRMYDVIRAADPTAYVILEHFAPNSEETQLINHRLTTDPNEPGMQVWGNFNFTYNQATMGYDNSDFSFIKYQNRGWSTPSNMSYMESHDEERLMYKNLEFGNSSGSYDITNLNTGLERLEIAGAFFFPIPGPKMLWQFGELGYDFSINYCPNGTIDNSCRTAPKPIPWGLNYNTNPNRTQVYDTWSKLINLKLQEPIFDTPNFTLEVSDDVEKKIFLVDDNAGPNDLEYVTIVGNFGVNTITTQPFFQETGTWYDLMTETPLQVNDTNMSITLAPGEFKMYGNELVTLSNEDFNTFENEIVIHPNPSSDYFSLNKPAKTITIYSVTGQIVKQFEGDFNINQRYNIEALNSGLYFVKVQSQEKTLSVKLIKD